MADEKTSEVIKIAASTIAAIASAFIGAHLGVVGTVGGAGVASVVTMGGTTVVQRSLERTQVKLRRRLVQGKVAEDGSREAPTVLLTPVTVSKPVKRLRMSWKWAFAGMAAVFVLTLGVLTLIEVGLGRPISGGNSGTTLTGLVGASTSTRVTVTHTTTETEVPMTTLVPLTTTTAPFSTTSAPSSSLETTTTTPTLTTTMAPPPTTATTVPPLLPSRG